MLDWMPWCPALGGGLKEKGIDKVMILNMMVPLQFRVLHL